MIVTFANTKGGVGKSTLAVHLAVWLFDRGAKVALLDADRQLSASQWVAEVEPKITVTTASSPEEVLSQLRGLDETHDFVIADGPGGLNDSSRTLLILSDLAIFPISPSILDLRSVSEATEALKYAQQINGGKTSGRLVLNRMRTRDKISRELKEAAPTLGVDVAMSHIRDLQPYRDAAGQGSVVTRMGRKAADAAQEMTQLFVELMTDKLAFLAPRDEGETTNEVSDGRKTVAQ